jgi:hypothetical protein
MHADGGPRPHPQRGLRPLLRSVVAIGCCDRLAWAVPWTWIRSERATTSAGTDDSARCQREPRPCRTARRTLSPQTHAPLNTLSENGESSASPRVPSSDFCVSPHQRGLRPLLRPVVAIRCHWRGLGRGFVPGSVPLLHYLRASPRARGIRAAPGAVSRASAAVHGSACVRDDAVGSMRVARITSPMVPALTPPSPSSET